MNTKRRRIRKQRHRTPTPTDDQAIAAFYAVCLNALKCAVADDGSLTAETDRMLRIGRPQIIHGVITYLGGHAAGHAINEHGSREAALKALSADLAEVLRIAEGEGAR